MPDALLCGATAQSRVQILLVTAEVRPTAATFSIQPQAALIVGG